MYPAPGPRQSRFDSIRISAKRVSAKILSPLRSTSESRARLSRVLLFYWLGMVAVIILAPFKFPDLPVVNVPHSGAWLDLIARVMLFIPLGFLFPLTQQGRNPRPLPVLFLGFVLGGAIAAVHPHDVQPLATTMSIGASGLG